MAENIPYIGAIQSVVNINITWGLFKMQILRPDAELLNQKLWGWGQPAMQVGTSPVGDFEAHSNLRITALPHSFPPSKAHDEKSML